MSPMRATRSFMAGALSLSLLAALLAVPAVVLAGVPNWVIVEEGNDTPGAVELPPRVTPGENAGYSVTIKNNGPGNISQLYFYADEAPNPVYSQPSRGTCANPEGTLFCSLGSLPAGQTARVVAAFPTPDDGSESFSVDFFFNTTGLGSGDSDSSHGDELKANGTTLLLDDQNFDGGFSTELGDSALTDAMSAANKVSTTLTAPANAKDLVLTVADEAAVLNDPACTDCAPLPTSELHLGDGSAQYGISTAVIEYHKDLVRLVNFKRLTVLHFHDDGSSHDIAFQRSCSGTTECAMFESLKGGHVRVTLYLAQNGWVKYH